MIAATKPIKISNKVKMISKERFSEIQANDILIFNGWRPRKVLSVKKWMRYKRETVLLTFRKVNGIGDTVYNYTDLKNKITAIVKPKTNK